ncbi:hypothetical protein INR49_001869 [Caranx melampygus]|nr:hypothetical protein INR49_001869 [Caranx melampygus]
MMAGDLKDNLKKLNNSMAFLINTPRNYSGLPAGICRSSLQWDQGSSDQADCVAAKEDGRPGPQLSGAVPVPAQQYTEEALKELFRHVHHNMPDSAKKKKLRQVHLVKQTNSGTPTSEHQQAPQPPARNIPALGLLEDSSRYGALQ